jgi:hypothetical protein
MQGTANQGMSCIETLFTYRFIRCLSTNIRAISSHSANLLMSPTLEILTDSTILQCDEVKPSCGTCTRYSSPCSYPTTVSYPPPQTSEPASSSSSSLLPPLSHSLSPSFINPISNTQFNIEQLELLHFYTTTTAYTFTTLPARAQIYSHVVPQIAFQHPFLLGGILALSALQLSHLSPSRKVSLQQSATLYHDPALASFKVALQAVTRENCDAVYIFSTFLVAYAWASSEGKGNIFFADEEEEDYGGDGGRGTAEWVRLLRGSRTLLRGCYDCKCLSF